MPAQPVFPVQVTYVNHHFVSASDAVVSVQDRGFRFGDGLFETLRIHAQVPYRWGWHMARLAAGAAAIHLPIDPSPLRAIAEELIARNQMVDGLLRIAVSRGIGSRGYLPTANAPTLVMETLTLPPTPEESVTLCLSQWEKPSLRALPTRYKLAQGMNSTLARLEAAERHCFDALQLDSAGNISETSAANIFWLKNGTLFTPSLDCGCLEGSTRAHLMELSPWPVKEGEFALTALKRAEAVFLTNVVLPVVGVAAIADTAYAWQSAEAAGQLRELIEQDRARYALRTPWE